MTNTTIESFHITREEDGMTSIGEAVASYLTARMATANIRVVAVIPLMLTYYTNCPERHLVTEVDLILETVR